SPDVSNKEIHLQMEIQRRNNRPYNGLIVGQGDKTGGYAVYAKNNRLFFEVYQHGQTATVTSRGHLPNEFVADARLVADGTMELLINGVSQGTAKAMHLFAQSPELNLRSGEDFGESHAFADYGESSRFIGNANRITVRLSKANHSAAGAHDDAAAEADPAASVPSERIELKAVKDIMQYDKKLITVP